MCWDFSSSCWRDRLCSWSLWYSSLSSTRDRSSIKTGSLVPCMFCCLATLSICGSDQMCCTSDSWSFLTLALSVGLRRPPTSSFDLDVACIFWIISIFFCKSSYRSMLSSLSLLFSSFIFMCSWIFWLGLLCPAALSRSVLSRSFSCSSHLLASPNCFRLLRASDVSVSLCCTFFWRVRISIL